jgi:NADH:ubiquinone oxidoreductase subunit F (NADH-binding)
MQVKKKIASDFCKNCTKCKGSDCAVNCMMRLLEGEKLPTSIDLEAFQNLSFDSSKARALLKTLSDYHDAHPEEARLNNAFEGVEKILNQAISRDEILKTIEFKES